MKTTSYIISKKLAEIGFRADHDFVWAKEDDGNNLICISVHSGFDLNEYYECIPVYDLEAIIDALPEFIIWRDAYFLQLTISPSKICYALRDTSKGGLDYQEFYDIIKQTNESLADCAARLLILLHEKGFVEFNN